MTSEEFARQARVASSTVERWRYEGHGPEPVRLGKRTVRYKRSDVDRFTGLADVTGGGE
jgi:predicted DNA-binding transcriptional regulator AlpA